MAGGARRVAAPATVEADPEPAKSAPAVRVHRSGLAFALSITIAALPILVLDNLPASAGGAEAVESSEVALATSEPTLPTPSTTVVAPTTTAPAPPPVVTTAPPPAPTTTAAPVQRVVAQQTPPTTQAPAPPPTAPPAAAKPGDPNDPATWDRMAQCEAGGNWSTNTGNGYYGGLQFSLTTWQHYGGTGYPHQASKATQIVIGKKLQAAKGWAAWPGCARRLGYI